MFQETLEFKKINIFENLKKYFVISPLSFMKAVRIEQIYFDPRTKYMCKYGCKNYGRKYSCPPYSYSLMNLIKKSNFRYVILFATTTKIPPESSYYKRRSLNSQKEYEIQKISCKLNEIFKQNGNKNIVFSGGSCKKCRPCTCVINRKCKKPNLKQTSMESIQIDCIKTMSNAGFDFQLTDKNTINRCGCIFTNDENLRSINFIKKESVQVYYQSSIEEIFNEVSLFSKLNSNLYEKFVIIPIHELNLVKSLKCNKDCKFYGNNFSCPPFSTKIDLSMWNYAIIWKWKENSYKKYSYNTALKRLHQKVYSLGHYFALSIRNCYCDECLKCSYNGSKDQICNSRKILSPSHQSIGIDLTPYDRGIFGIELF